ncbi:hypothetical protein AB0M10_15325 [Streptomyces sp. NPDC051840]|uniref:hypothetical protein n=1 Tax=Streptomyces sp. NPDC051840 TaxID=3154752 RepID=UPI0034256B2E
MPEQRLNLTPRKAAELLHSVAEVLYLDPACSAGHHQECPGADRYTSRVCCCITCEHADLDARGPLTVATPLLHVAASPADRCESHDYANGEELGVRADMVQALEKALEQSLWLPAGRRHRLAVELGITAALVVAPRSL